MAHQQVACVNLYELCMYVYEKMNVEWMVYYFYKAIEIMSYYRTHYYKIPKSIYES